jgi:hypothetical protein
MKRNTHLTMSMRTLKKLNMYWVKKPFAKLNGSCKTPRLTHTENSSPALRTFIRAISPERPEFLPFLTYEFNPQV